MMANAAENVLAHPGSLSVNPATGETVALHPWLGEREVAEAVDAASAAFDVWRDISCADRGAALRRTQ